MQMTSITPGMDISQCIGQPSRVYCDAEFKPAPNQPGNGVWGFSSCFCMSANIARKLDSIAPRFAPAAGW